MDTSNLIGQYEGSERNVEYIPALSGAGPETTVEIFNPLPQDFSVKFAVSVAQAPTLTADQQRFQERMAQFGIPVTKTGNTMAHAVKYTVIPAGKSVKLPGHVAQVAVRQLVTEIIQRRGARNRIADPQTRKDVEQEIILNYSALVSSVSTGEDAIDRQIRELNDPATQLTQLAKESDEQPFATPDPAPGTGVSYDSKVTATADRPAPRANKQA